MCLQSAAAVRYGHEMRLDRVTDPCPYKYSSQTTAIPYVTFGSRLCWRILLPKWSLSLSAYLQRAAIRRPRCASSAPFVFPPLVPPVSHVSNYPRLLTHHSHLPNALVSWHTQAATTLCAQRPACECEINKNCTRRTHAQQF